MRQELESIVRKRVTADGLRWFEGALAASASRPQLSALLRAYTAAPRHVGRAALDATAEEIQPFLQVDPEWSFAQWTIEDAARAALLAAIGEAETDADHFYELATGCYEQGDSREQQSWLRAALLLPQPERFTMTAIDACRTNIVPLFESIACENPFPSRYFPDRNFNQLVLKALFNGIALERIVKLSSRLNPELSRMADDYVTEREAAGRPVPADIWVVVSPYADEYALARVRQYLQHHEPAHRRWAEASLAARPKTSRA